MNLRILYLLLSFFYAHYCVARNISLADSLRLERYLDSADRAPLFSQKRQRVLDSMILIKPTEAWYWQQKAMPLFKQHKYELGMQYMDSAVKYDTHHHWEEYRAFIRCIFQKNYSKAINEFKILKKYNPEGVVMDHSYDFHIGLSYLQLNQFDSAAKYLNASIVTYVRRFKVGHYTEYWYRGIVSMEQEKLDEAILYFDTAIKLYTNLPEAKYYKAKCMIYQSKNDEALVLMKEVVADMDKGYTLNEDQLPYEEYPYQIRKFWATQFLESHEPIIMDKKKK
jgi:tetratricopeptide (TPR) repeat protein